MGRVASGVSKIATKAALTMLTASAMSVYQDAIEKAVVLALFVPLIISSGGNSGGSGCSGGR
mgnify:CR=1 FL=1